jgi:dipeptidyl aminopeptidase/acylaminoacyl peptidase
MELTNLSIAPDGRRLVWVRGGDHDANWPAEGGLQPNPAAVGEKPALTVWTALLGGKAVPVTEGDAPIVSATGRLAFVKDGQAWTAPLDGKGRAAPLFFDRGRVRDLLWSPDGSRLAFVSDRGDHAFVGIWSGPGRTVVWMAPATMRDGSPVWSPDGTRVAYLRTRTQGLPLTPLLTEVAQPFSVMIADATTGQARQLWKSPATANGSYPEVPDGPFLMWAAGDRLTFRAELDGWPHLYSLPVTGGDPLLLTPGAFMVEHVSLSADRQTLLFSANTGSRSGDEDRRHVFSVPVDRPGPTMLTQGEGLEWSPVAAGEQVAFVAADARSPATIKVAGRAIEAPAPYAPAASFIVPRAVTFRAADGTLVHGQLFDAGGQQKKPGLIFVHGGPSRQMLLGWHYMGYYAHAYAMNQYLASRGFAVLSVNYRLGIGYGRAFQHADKGGASGSSEYQDVLAGAKLLRTLPGVDGERIGIWGGSYGGLLTALALARDSDIFKAGVDFHGVHDWSQILGERGGPPKGYQKGDWDAAMKIAFTASPVADVGGWTSPVLLIHGDDDRNVRFNQTVDLSRRLEAKGGVVVEELILPNEIHDFLRWQNWLRADTATVTFLEKTLMR